MFPNNQSLYAKFKLYWQFFSEKFTLLKSLIIKEGINSYLTFLNESELDPHVQDLYESHTEEHFRKNLSQLYPTI